MAGGGRNPDVWPRHFCQGIAFSLAGELHLICPWDLEVASVYFLVGSWDKKKNEEISLSFPDSYRSLYLMSYEINYNYQY